MGFTIRNVAFDCTDPYELATFWSALTGHPLHPEDAPGEPVAMIEQPDGPNLYFQQVPEAKVVKNRVHVCLTPDALRDTEVDRLLTLGARVLEDRREADGTGWVVFADPEGNEFCVLRSEAERQAVTPTSAG